jgi:hypothetical protein
MRRDHFTLTADNTDTDDPAQPTLSIRYDGPEETLTSQLGNGDGGLLAADEIDAALRLQDSVDDADAMGVFSLTHRITGEYLIEANVDAAEIIDLVTATRNESDGETYRIEIERDDGETVVYEMDSLIVYDDSGELLRQYSLIPSGVEL